MSLRAAALLLLCGALGCASDPDTLEGLLARTPEDDTAWTEAKNAAAEGDRLDAFALEAQALADAHPDAWAPAWIAGEAWDALDEAERASAAFDAAWMRARASGSRVGVAHVANELGWKAYVDGRLESGAEIYLEGIRAARAAERVDLEAFLHSNLAGLRLEQNRFADARDELRLAADGLAAAGMGAPAVSLGYNRAVLEWRLGDLATLERSLDELESRAAEIGDVRVLDSSAILRGHLARMRGDAEGAARAYDAVSGDDVQLRATAALGRGHLESARERWDAAREAFAHAAGIAASDEPLIAALSETLLADLEFAHGDVEAGEAALRRAVEQADEREDAVNGWIARHRLGRRLLEAGRTEEARAPLDEAVERLGGIDEGLDPLSEGLYLMRGRAQAYVDAARAAGDDAERVWRLASEITGRALRGVGVLDAAPPLAGVRATLRGDEAMLVLLDGDPGLSMLVRRGRVWIDTVSGLDALGAVAARDLVDALPTCGASPSRGGSERSEVCRIVERTFGAWTERLAGVDRLWIVPTGGWTRWPFAATPWPGGRFGERFAYAILPTPARPPAPSADGPDPSRVHLFGPPVFDGDEDRAPLPFAAREIARLSELWGEPAHVVSGDALTARAVEALDDAPVALLHLATHAVASTTDPRGNGIVLSGGEIFGLDDVLDRRMDEAVVVLSACRTADGERVPGQGRLGLAWAFQVAGASWVVATHDAVDDRATSEAMIAFHRAIRDGADPPAALRTVRRAFAGAVDTASIEVYARPGGRSSEVAGGR